MIFNQNCGKSCKKFVSNLWTHKALLVWGYCAFLFFWSVSAYAMLIMHGYFKWDYFKYYQCGAMALSVDRFDVYDPAVQMHWYNRIIYPLRVNSMAYNQYSPVCFLLMIPLALFPLDAGYYIWVAGTLAFGILGLYFLLRVLGVPFLKQRLTGLIIACLSSYPAFQGFQLGQSSWFLIGCLSFLFYGLIAHKSVLSGLMCALTIIKPQYGLFISVLLFGKKRFRSLAYAALFSTLLLLLCTFVIGWENVLYYPKIVMDAETSTRVFGVFQENMICLRGILSRLLPHSLLMETLFGIEIVSCVLLWRQISLSPPEENWSWIIAITILMVLIFSPHVHIYDSQLIIIAAVATLGQKAGISLFRIWSALLWLYPLFSWTVFLILNIPGGDIQNYPLVFLSYHLLLLFLALSILRLQRRPYVHQAHLPD